MVLLVNPNTLTQALQSQVSAPALSMGQVDQGLRFEVKPSQSGQSSQPIAGVSRVSEPSEVTSASAQVEQVMDRTGGLDLYKAYNFHTREATRLDAEEGLYRTEAAEHRRKAQDCLLGMQMLAQEHHMKVELAGKVVEHASSGARTVLQTQV